MSNKISTHHQRKKAQEHAVISIIATFALLTCSMLPTNDIFAVAPNDPEKTGCNPQTDTDCFPDEIVAFNSPSDTSKASANIQFVSTNLATLNLDPPSNGYLNSNTPTDSSVDIEADELVVKGCKGGTAGEVPGKPGVCKEERIEPPTEVQKTFVDNKGPTRSNTPTDSSVDIEADELVVKGCKGGTAGEVPGKPGVCKE